MISAWFLMQSIIHSDLFRISDEYVILQNKIPASSSSGFFYANN